MRIGMILDNEFTGDMRVENEVYSLQEAGHSVVVLCFNHGSKLQSEDFCGAEIIRFRLSKFLKNKLKPFILTKFDFFSRIWAFQINKILGKKGIDVLHVHDLYMLPSAFLAQQKLNFKIVADLHENYPEALKNYSFVNKFPGKFIISISKWHQAEIDLINKADAVITVIEEALERYKKLGVEDKNLYCVPNYVNVEFFMTKSEMDESLIHEKNNFVLLYIGGFDIHRGLESLIKAIQLTYKIIPSIKLVLVGDGKIRKHLEEMVGKLGIQDHVTFEGWQKPESLPDYIRNSDLCLIPHLKTEHTDNTIPHKLFHYMLMQKPVLASNCAPIKRIIEKHNAGRIFEADNENDLSEKIISLFKEKDILLKMGKNGHEAVLSKYTWDAAKKGLLNLYENLES